MDLGDNYIVTLNDTWGDSWNGGSLSIGGVAYTIDGVNDDGSDAITIIGSCGVTGCDDMNATNYDDAVTINDGSCTYDCPLVGSGGVSYDDPSSTSYACYDYVWNLMWYDVAAMEGFGYDCSCVEDPIVGCMDTEADNFNADADIDGGCTYTCAVATVNMVDEYGDGWDTGSLTIGTETFTLGAGAVGSACLESVDGCLAWTLGGSAYNYELSFTVTDADGAILFEGAGESSGEYGDCSVAGCMDATACNYNADATEEDGSCELPAAGFDCAGNCIGAEMVIAYNANGESWTDEDSWTITDSEGNYSE